MPGRIVIVGGGEAAVSCIATLRASDAAREIVLVGEEAYLPYRRPPLSKGCLIERLPPEKLALRPLSWFDGIDLRLGCRAEAIERNDGRIVLGTGERLAYDHLVLCTGMSARRLERAAGGALAGVHTLRHLSDAVRLEADLVAGRRLLVVGGGYIGLEVAAAARARDMSVVLIEAGPRILGRVASASTADHMRALHAARGVEIREATGLAALIGDGRVQRAILSDGSEIAVDVVVVGIGARPNDDLASSAGIATENGIAVDDLCRTSDPQVLAAGDCASFPLDGRRMRLESVQNASEQGEAVAATLLGAPKPYKPIPWFWSDQYDTKLQIVGLGEDHDEIVIRPGRRNNAKSFWYFKGERLLAVDAINDPASYMAGRRLLAAGVNPDRRDIADGSTALAGLLPAAA
ncbi:MAG TPA: FAD-dependent oxidoreductase [Lichenihabitans sp.]|jgi:3-phenylpropionate/trans-cinnamate dioxygenase ferredoxin reductase subunit|nr:FAD-dependent oxidoreductase [Lichenihabitans sp.]